MFPDKANLQKKIQTDPDGACDLLDANGFLPRPGESREDFLARALKEPYESPELDDTFTDALPLSPAILSEGAERTRSLYGFEALYVPGYALKRGFGILWAGCTLTDDQDRSVFALRFPFAKQTRWFIYDRSELLAHEQTHAARTPVNDTVHEEYFAYQTSVSPLRRYLGNCFRTATDSVIFLLGLIPLFVIEAFYMAGVPILPMWPFALFAFLYPTFLLIRNQLARNVMNRAKQNLSAAGKKQIMPLLFRATAQEIAQIAKSQDIPALLSDLQKRELRWAIALRRFK